LNWFYCSYLKKTIKLNENSSSLTRVILGGRTDITKLVVSFCNCQDNIKMYLRKVGWGYMDWMDLAQDRDRWWTVVNAVMNLWVL
jgi:hypothetical protein